MAIPAVAVPQRGTPVHLDASEKSMDIRFQCPGPDQWQAEILPAVAEKGLMVLDVIAHGKSGHCCTAIPNCACRAYWPSAWAPVKT